MVTQGSADAVFKALSDPTRRAILASLREQPQAVSAIAGNFSEMSRPAVSKHLRILREAGLVTENQRGRQRLYQFVSSSLDEAGIWLDAFKGSRDAEGRGLPRAGTSDGPQRGTPAEPNDWQAW